MGSAWCMSSLDRTFTLCPATIGLAAMLLASANLFYRASALLASFVGRPLNLANIARLSGVPESRFGVAPSQRQPPPPAQNLCSSC
jgi:hypothetical protein